MIRAIFFSLLWGTSLAAADTSRQLGLVLADSRVRVDGVIDGAWALADSATDFFQMQPYFHQAPSRQTVAKVLGTPEALFCLIVSFDDRRNIQENAGVHDQASGDIVSLMLDTFGDGQTAYKFAVTAAGVRSDCRLLDDARNRDYSWDGVWFAAAKVYDWGFVVEMEIPYKSIRYDPSLGEWGLDFDRWIPANMEDLYWSPYEQNEGQRISRFGRLRLDGFSPAMHGLNLEVYPVAFSRASLLGGEDGDVTLDAGLDIFYNPSEKLTFQLTVNPDFAQIEADPFSFNISRYETYFSEQRPFFTEGNEIFMASGRERNSGFYRPLELFYSRRIGKILPDGAEVPLTFGTKAFGRLGEWEYGGFVALAGETMYEDEGERLTEPRAAFGSVRLKRKVLGNSSLGALFVGKRTREGFDGVLDIDGAIRTSSLQLPFQIARSLRDGRGDFAGSVGFGTSSRTWIHRARLRAVGKEFDISQVGYVPWQGTVEAVGLSGPQWFYEEGAVARTLVYVGPAITYEDADLATDWAGLLGLNMQFRDNWGFELNLLSGRSKDQGETYTYYEASGSSWLNTSPLWNGSFWGGYSRGYNFSREYVGFFSWGGFSLQWKATPFLDLGTSFDTYVEGRPDNVIEDITYNARPVLGFSPFNDMRLRVYIDNVFVQSVDRMDRVLIGLLFSYNFLPKSWIYVALNELRERGEGIDAAGSRVPGRMRVADRVGVVKVKYLHLF